MERWYRRTRLLAAAVAATVAAACSDAPPTAPPRPVADDAANRTIVAGDTSAVGTGDVTHGAITDSGQVNRYTFTAAAGNAVIIHIAETNGNTTFIPWIRLLRPDGAQIGSSYGDLVGSINLAAPTTGTYTVLVAAGDARRNTRGTYELTRAIVPGSFTVPDGDEGGPMTNGANHAGHIHLGDLDEWTFSANTGEAILLKVAEAGANTSFVPYIRLFRPDGAQIASNYGDLAASISLNAPTNGTYTVVVTAGDNGGVTTGDYLLTLAKAPGALVVSPGDEGGPMTPGANHRGHLHLGDLDSWTFTATQGQAVFLNVGEFGPNTNFIPYIRLFRPDGAQIGASYGDLGGQISLNAPTSGTYTVVVASGDPAGVTTGDYQLTLALSPGDFVVPTGDEGGPMTNGANHTGHIHLHDIDSWTFSAAQGEAILLNIGELGTNTAFVPYMRLIRPDGAQIASNYGDLGAQISLNAPTSGTYTVIVTAGDNGGNTTGDYQLTLAKAPGAFVVPAGDEGGPMINGANHQGHIHLHDLDSWTFTAAQGEAVVLNLGEVGANTAFVPYMRLFRPDGAQIAASYGDLGGQIALNAPTSGTYTVVVSAGDPAGNTTGDYQLTLAKVPGTFVVPTGDQGGPITNGANHTGHIHLHDLDSWTFTAAQGEAILLNVGELGANTAFVPYMRLFRPDGAQIASNYGDLGAQISLNAPTNGTYTVVISAGDNGGNTTGDYQLTLAKAPGTFTVSPGDEGGPMTNGANHQGHIHLHDLDSWTFTAAQGEAILLNLGERGANTAFVPYMRLFRPDGAQIGASYGDLGGQIALNAPTSGTYTVVVSAGDPAGNTTGDYQLTLAKAPGAFVVPAGDEGGPMTNGANHAGHIHLHDLDSWTFTAAQGEAVLLTVAESGMNTPFVPYIRLFRPDGAQIASNYGDLTGSISLNAPTAGTYTVVVSAGDNGGNTTGDYTLRLVKTAGGFVVPAGDNGGSLGIGNTVSGTIDLGDLDPWTVTAVAGDRLNFTVTDAVTGSPFIPYIRLFRPDGAQIGAGYGDASGQINIAMPVSGTYTVVVGAGDAPRNGTGSYTLRTTRLP